jgi:hypothetical protein
VQPVDLVAIMAAIIYSGRNGKESEKVDSRQSAVEGAWQLWHLTMKEWSDAGIRHLDEPPPAA